MTESTNSKRLFFNRTDKVGLIANIALSVALVLVANGLIFGLGWNKTS